MRFHLPALPGRSIDKVENSSCAYSMKIAKFARMMEARGHECFVYEHPGEPLEFDPALWIEANADQAKRINENREDGDFLCLIAGRCQQAIAEAVPLMAVEYGIGYGGTFADFRVFESYAWMHAVYAQGQPDAHAVDGKFFDAVIPNYFEAEDFPDGEGGDYLLYVGRMIERKGVQVAAETAERLGMELLLAGEGPDIPGYGTHLGSVGPEERAELMGGARALLAPTLYLEPFGGVAVEAQLCGTPAITTDWGAFTETVAHGRTGFRCRTLSEFCQAVEQAEHLDRDAIRTRAIERYSLEAIGLLYETYFNRLATLCGDGWYEMSGSRTKVN